MLHTWLWWVTLENQCHQLSASLSLFGFCGRFWAFITLTLEWINWEIYSQESLVVFKRPMLLRQLQVFMIYWWQWQTIIKLFYFQGKGGGGGIIAAVGGLTFIGGGSAAAYYSLVTVQPGHQGIVYSRFGGVVDNWTLNEGLNFIIPWFHRAIVYDVRTRPQPIDTQSGSKGDSPLFHNISFYKFFMLHHRNH